MKVDLKQELDSYRAKRGEFRVIEVPSHRYLMADGHGDPNTSPDFARAVESLYPVAYRLKFASKQQLDRDYVVPPLEGLWWSDDMATFTQARDKSRWSWTLMLLVPDWIAPSFAHEVGLEGVRLEEYAEGTCVQTLHVGPFDDEGPVLAQLHDEAIPSHGLVMTGHHHEIYLSDRRRTAPERLRTILRQPVGPDPHR